MAMGRKRKTDRDMPARVYQSHGAWYLACKDGPWVRLGVEKHEALKRYAELMQAGPQLPLMRDLLARYLKQEMPLKAPKTRAGQEKQLETIGLIFGHMPIEDVTRDHVQDWIDQQDARISANRQLALLSHVFTKAIRWKLAKVNPCRGVEKNTEKPRTRYVTDAEFMAVYERAGEATKVMMALALLTGQRQADLLKLRRSKVQAEGLHFQQGKTGKQLIVEWSDALRWVMQEAGALPAEGRSSMFVVCRPDGQPYSSSGFQTNWQKLMAKCMADEIIGERFTFHDLRAKAGSDAKNGRLLGHADQRLFERVYRRKAELVAPVR